MTDPLEDFLDLGDEFEILDDDAVAAESPAETPLETPAVPPEKASKTPAPVGNPNMPSSTVSWHGFGSLLALGGLLGTWGQVGSHTLLHGLALVFVLREFFRFGLGAPRPVPGPVFQPKKPWLLPAGPLSLLTGVILLIASTSPFASVLVILGGVLLLGAPFLGKKKDASRVSIPEPQTDVSFEKSLAGYLAVLVGLFLPWCSSGVLGMEGIGLVVLLLVFVAAWASRAGVWKSWSFPLVTSSAKLGGLLFVAPLVADIYGMLGILRVGVPTAFGGALQDFWPSQEGVESSFLEYGAGPILVFAGSLLATVVLVRGAKEAQIVAGERKKASIEARKASRAERNKK